MKRSKHSLSHYRLLSCDMGKLIPIACFDVLPGDSIQMATSLLLRVAPLVTPVMHPVTVRVHHWYVPNRLLWENWEEFITGGPDGLNASVHPTKTGTVNAGQAVDYLGIPLGAGMLYNVLPLRAYVKIWNEFYRDEDLVTAGTENIADGNDTTTSALVRDIMWEKDYLTSSRPWEQKGPTVTIPLGTRANVLGIAVEDLDPVSGGMPNARRSGEAEGTYPQWFNQDAAPTAGYDIFLKATGAGASGAPDVWADLTGASAITINALREAAAIQRYEENRARGGSRYSEYLRVLGVRSSDARLQRPEYLGGGKQTIQFSEVLQTGTDGTNPIGTMRGHGISALRSNRFRRFFEEHGWVISLLSVRPKTIYTNGQERMFNRSTKFDYFQKELQHIGSQPVLNKEAYALHATPLGTFGFQDRYDEYRRKESGVSGEFATSILNSWHMARDFASAPALNSSFVTCNPTTRNLASATNDPLYVMARHSIQARRLVAKSGTARLS